MALSANGLACVAFVAEQPAEGGESGAEKGRGPRIYVGGIPTAVSETMVRNHFSQWGTVLDVVSMRPSHMHFLWGSPMQACHCVTSQ